MKLILITPEMIQTQSNTIRKYRQAHLDTMGNLSQLVLSLNESWKGEAQDAFVSKFRSMENVYRRFSEILDSYADLIDKTASEFSEADQALKNQIASID